MMVATNESHRLKGILELICQSDPDTTLVAIDSKPLEIIVYLDVARPDDVIGFSFSFHYKFMSAHTDEQLIENITSMLHGVRHEGDPE